MKRRMFLASVLSAVVGFAVFKLGLGRLFYETRKRDLVLYCPAGAEDALQDGLKWYMGRWISDFGTSEVCMISCRAGSWWNGTPAVERRRWDEVPLDDERRSVPRIKQALENKEDFVVRRYAATVLYRDNG